jgi:predicted MFS family arabinose efflux permease
MAFALQSIQKRLPKLIGPALAGGFLGWMATRMGDDETGHIIGMQWLVGFAFALGVISLAVQWRFMPRKKNEIEPGPLFFDLHNYPHILRRLLAAEIFTRWCDWLVREFVVLYVMFVRGVSVGFVGLLIALQHAVALATYLPIGRLTQTVGRQPFIGLTFIFFAAFPLVLYLVPDGPWIVIAFIVYGLREIGEPARKALITTNIPEAVRAQGVGWYWGLRSFAICTASLAGALIWQTWGPEALLLIAAAAGSLGAAIFYGLVYSSEQP